MPSTLINIPATFKGEKMMKKIFAIQLMIFSFAMAQVDPCKKPVVAKKANTKKALVKKAPEPSTYCNVPQCPKGKRHELYGLLGRAPSGLNKVNGPSSAIVTQDYDLEAGIGYSYTLFGYITVGAEAFTNKSFFGRVGVRF